MKKRTVFLRRDGQIVIEALPAPFTRVVSLATQPGKKFQLHSLPHPTLSNTWAMLYIEQGTVLTHEVRKKLSDQLFPSKVV